MKYINNDRPTIVVNKSLFSRTDSCQLLVFICQFKSKIKKKVLFELTD